MATRKPRGPKPIPESRVCRGCKEELASSEFYVKINYHGNPGLESRCKECRKEANKKDYFKHHESNLKKKKEYRASNLELCRARDRARYQDKDKREKVRAWAKRDREENPRKHKDRKLRYYHGIGLEQFENLLIQQNNRCEICSEKFSEVLKPNVDHNHVTGKVRGILCSGCNTALGLLKELPDLFYKAVDYLRKYRDDSKK